MIRRDEHSVFADLVMSFFTRHLAVERNASPHTIASYRDSFRLLLRYVAESTGRTVSRISMDDINPDTILGFLDHLEQIRSNSIRTRNVRLAAIHSFFSYAISHDPEIIALGRRALAIPFKKAPGRLTGYLSEEELRAILDRPDRTTARGRRDYLALALLYDTGARVQELVSLRPVDFRLDRISLVRITGKGRKQRIVPLMPAAAKLVRDHLDETGRSREDKTVMLRNYRGEPMTRSGVAFLLDKYRCMAAEHVSSLRRQGISPHTMRHTKAMHLLQSGVSPVTIKDILGHAHLETLEIYVQADLEMKRQALDSAASPVDAKTPAQRHEPDLLRWLEDLTLST